MADTFGKRLRAAMEGKGWRQGDLAKHAKIHTSAVGRHLEAVRLPSSASIGKYAQALEVSTEWLAYGRETRTVSDAPPVYLRGVAALDAVLDEYEWPAGLSASAMDAICEELRHQAETATQRPTSVWRALLTEMIANSSGPRKVASVVRR